MRVRAGIEPGGEDNALLRIRAPRESELVTHMGAWIKLQVPELSLAQSWLL